jgi:hypothetical protein
LHGWCAGQYDEALRRRREGELSRAALQAKIEAFKQRRRPGKFSGEE